MDCEMKLVFKFLYVLHHQLHFWEKSCITELRGVKFHD